MIENKNIEMIENFIISKNEIIDLFEVSNIQYSTNYENPSIYIYFKNTSRYSYINDVDHKDFKVIVSYFTIFKKNKIL